MRVQFHGDQTAGSTCGGEGAGEPALCDGQYEFLWHWAARGGQRCRGSEVDKGGSLEAAGAGDAC